MLACQLSTLSVVASAVGVGAANAIIDATICPFGRIGRHTFGEASSQKAGINRIGSFSRQDRVLT